MGYVVRISSSLLVTNSNIDCDEYLPPSTLSWCQNQLSKLGVKTFKEDPLYHTTHDAYLCLRKITNDYINTNQLPLLVESAKPIGGYRWLPTQSFVQEEVATIESMDLLNEG